MKSFIEEFKAFAMKGNVLDLAVAVVIGGAFGKIVTSLVTDIITPVIGLLMGGINFSGMSYTLGSAVVTYGVFIQSVIDFIIVAVAIFLVVKAINKAQAAIVKKEAEAKEEVQAVPTEDILLLREIRDALRR
jgi:large conductance mechanosensitive channel